MGLGFTVMKVDLELGVSFFRHPASNEDQGPCERSPVGAKGQG